MHLFRPSSFFYSSSTLPSQSLLTPKNTPYCSPPPKSEVLTFSSLLPSPKYPYGFSSPSDKMDPTTNPAMIGTLIPSDDDDSHPSIKKPSSSPWHRMKWTDDVVRLLISLVSYVGDDVTPSDAHASTPKSIHQKKGKWKTVSKLMLEKGLFVSPQQCEDKFNDLNKRYKRLNEILGRGTTCQVVENPSLLDSMPQIPPKSKDDVRKILSSKHLFYREMCAYHNGQKIVHVEDDEEEKDRSIMEDEEEDEEEEEEGAGVFGRADSLGAEIDGMGVGQKREWLGKRRLELMEERAEIEAEGVEIAKRRMKWEKFRSKKDWEMERAAVENERMRLENERMALQLRRKEMELDAEHRRVE